MWSLSVRDGQENPNLGLMTLSFLRSQLPDRVAGYLADNGTVSSVSLVPSCL